MPASPRAGTGGAGTFVGATRGTTVLPAESGSRGATYGRYTQAGWQDATAAAYFLLPPSRLFAARSNAHFAHSLNPFLIAFGSGFHGLFAGLVPIAGSASELAGIEVSKPSVPVPEIPRLVKKLATPFVHPMTFVPESTPWRIGFFLGVLLVAGIALMASSLLPSRFVRWTSVPVNDFVAARGYVAILGASILVAVALAYALGAVQP